MPSTRTDFIRAFIGIYRQRVRRTFEVADSQLGEWARKRSGPGSDVIVRQICSVYGQFDFVVLVDAEDLKALHRAVQNLGAEPGISGTETFIVNNPSSDLGNTFVDRVSPLQSCVNAVLCLRVNYGPSPETDFDKAAHAKGYRVSQCVPAFQTFSDAVADELRRADSRVVAAEAVFGKFDVMAIVDDKDIETPTGKTATIHEFLQDLVTKQVWVIKTALLRTCPVSSGSQFLS